MAENSLSDIKKPELLYSRYRIVFHILFWVSLLLYDGLIWGLVDGKYDEKFISSLAELPIKIAASYFTLYVLIDRFLVLKKYTLFIVLLLVSMAVSGTLLRFISFYLLYPIYYPEGLSIPLLFLPKILIAIFYTYSVVAIMSTFHLVRRYYKHQQAEQQLRQMAEQLEKEKLAAELKLLKSQINPHFLFNTLNNLYVLTLDQSPRAPAMVHKLSELMSYMLYDSNQAEVLLEKEIQYIRNYIDLEKLRYGTRVEITFTNYAKTEGITVAPLMMLPFVENAFKHGARKQLEGGWIHIDLDMQDQHLILKVENNKPETRNETDKPGIGLQNVVKRLDHLYPARYTLQLFDEADTFMAVLRLSVNKQTVKESLIKVEINY